MLDVRSSVLSVLGGGSALLSNSHRSAFRLFLSSSSISSSFNFERVRNARKICRLSDYSVEPQILIF